MLYLGKNNKMKTSSYKTQVLVSESKTPCGSDEDNFSQCNHLIHFNNKADGTTLILIVKNEMLITNLKHLKGQQKMKTCLFS